MQPFTSLANFFNSFGQWARRVRRDAVTLWFASRHPRTPWAPKVLCLFVVAYALSPIDLIPDFIPILGYLDDALLLPVLIWLAIRLIPPTVMEECRIQGDAWMMSQGRKPRSLWGAALIIAIWLAGSWAIWTYLIVPRLN